MVKYFFQHIPVLARIFILASVTMLISACNWFGGGDEANVTAPPAILAPADSTRVLLGGPVYIQSGQYGSEVSRVELWVKKPSAPAEQLVRSDIPQGGGLLQEWRPTEAGPHTVRIKTFRADNSLVVEQVRNYEIIPDAVVSLTAPPAAAPPQPNAQLQPTPVPPTPLLAPAGGSADLQTGDTAVIVEVVATSTPNPTATPVPRYPPPPPAPGVPPGPIQTPLLNVSPPVCDAAEYLGPYASDTSRRIVITEDDDLAPRVVGGTTVFRAFRMQNVGTCTWGTGYELAFYGGRTMGSGGVAFEYTFPTDPARRNTIVDRGRLIVPEGKPNQTAVLEVALVTPVTPGIHQSFWRMRNPHGVFFGPVVGVTMEVVRDCGPGIYGSPVINRFEILGVGDVYRPTNPINVRAEVGEYVILDYQVINASNVDIVFEDPTGRTSTESPDTTSDRARFLPNRLGRHTLTLYADNGSCSIPATVYVDVIPRAGSEFELDVLLAAGAPVTPADQNASFSAAVTPGTLQAQWQHYDKDVNEIFFSADLYQRRRGVSNCLIPGWSWTCGQSSGEWTLVRRASPGQVGTDADGAAVVCRSSERCNQLPREIAGAQAGAAQTAEPISIAEHLTSIFCPADTTLNPNVEYGVNYYLEARKNGAAATPSKSNEVFVICAVTADTGDSGPAISEGDTQKSCTLNQIGGITLPFACQDVPIVAGVSLVLLLVVFWIFFK